MFFAIAKTLGWFAYVSNIILVLAVVGIALAATRFTRLSRMLLISAVSLLAIFGFSPAPNWLIYPLEARFPKWDHSRGPPDGIIVLGGAIVPAVSAARGEASLSEAAERVTAIAALARRYPDAPIVYTGGNPDLLSGPDEAQFVVPLFESFGIARQRVQVENKARDTAENAIFAKQLVQPKAGQRWLLVTSAHHMPRSIGLFRGANFPVEAYPVDWSTGGSPDLTSMFRRVSEGLARTDAATHEWAGLAANWLTGRSKEFFPSVY